MDALIATNDIEHHRLAYVEAFERIVTALKLPANVRAKHASLLSDLVDAAAFHRKWYLRMPSEWCDEHCGTIIDNARRYADGDAA